MKATNWIEKNPTKLKKKDDYEKTFELLHIKTDTMKQNFRTLGKAVVENDQETIESVLNYLKENTSRNISAEEIDGLKFIAEFSERGPQAMAYHQLYEQYFPKHPDFDHIEKVPADIFDWRDSQGVNRIHKPERKKSSHNHKDRGLYGGLI
jgi:hypothetical protein